MHIVHIIESSDHGVFIWVYEVVNELIKKGHQVSLIYSLRKGHCTTWREKFDSRVNFINVDMSRNINPILDIKSLRNLYKKINQLNPDILHAHGSKPGFLVRLAALMAKKQNKVFYTPHAIYYPLAPNLIKQKSFKYLEVIAAKFGGKIIACSRQEQNLILKEICQHSKQVLLLNNSINMDIIIPKDYGQKNEKIKIGVLGRISKQKAPEKFKKIAADLLSSRDDVEFIWIGGGKYSDVYALQEIGINVTGELTREEAMLQLSSLDIFLQTSLYEGMSLALLEAQAAGIVSVVSNAQGNADVVYHGKTGYIGYSDEELINYLKQLVDSESLRIQLGEAARDYAIRYFSFEQMHQKLLRFYQNSLDT